MPRGLPAYLLDFCGDDVAEEVAAPNRLAPEDRGSTFQLGLDGAPVGAKPLLVLGSPKEDPNEVVVAADADDERGSTREEGCVVAEAKRFEDDDDAL